MSWYILQLQPPLVTEPHPLNLSMTMCVQSQYIGNFNKNNLLLMYRTPHTRSRQALNNMYRQYKTGTFCDNVQRHSSCFSVETKTWPKAHADNNYRLCQLACSETIVVQIQRSAHSTILIRHWDHKTLLQQAALQSTVSIGNNHKLLVELSICSGYVVHHYL